MDVKDKISMLADTRVEGARLVYYSNRSTPQVVKNGEKAKPKAGYGKVVKTRKATKEEEAQIRKGKWIRTRHDGKKPGDKGSKRSSYRPQLGKKQKIRADENTEESTDNFSYTLQVKVREFNKYGTIENILENIKGQTDIGLLTTITITNSNGFISKFQIGGERDSEVSPHGVDTIISIDKTDNPNKSYENPEPEEK